MAERNEPRPELVETTSVATLPLIVCIDDNKANLELLSDHLTMAGMRHETFLDSRDALSCVTWDPPQLIILDLYMPGLDGFEFLRRVHENLDGACPPIIILSCDDGEASLTRAFELGAVDYLRKPFAHGELVAKIKRALGTLGKSSSGEARRQPKHLGPFIIEKEIGRGGMGVVYRARREGLVKPGHPQVFAVKVLDAGFKDSDALLRFRREIDVLQALTHSHLARVYEAGRQDDLFYFAMDFIDGSVITDYFSARRPIDPLALAQVLHTILGVLNFIHSRGVVHRDIKPGNILVTRDDQPYLVDFGLAKSLVDTQLTRHSQIVGTPNFMAPEVIRGEDIDGRADLFSLGMVAVEIFRDVPAFDYENSYRILSAICAGDYPRLASVENAPPPLVPIIDTMLETKAENRYANALEARAALERAYPSLT